MINKKLEYEFTLSKWHIDNISLILKAYLLNSYSLNINIDKLLRSVEDALQIVNTTYQTENIKVKIKSSSDFYFVNLTLQFYKNDDEPLLIIEEDFLDTIEQISNKKTSLSVNDNSNIASFRIIKPLPLGIFGNIIQWGVFTFIFVYFLLSLIFKFSITSVAITGIIWSLLTFGIIKLMDFLNNKADKAKTAEIKEKIQANKKINLQYENFLAQYYHEASAGKTQNFIDDIEVFNNEIKSKTSEVKSQITREADYIEKCYELIKKIKTQDDETIDIISSTNKKLESKKNSITGLLQSTSKKIDSEVSLSHNLTKKVEKSVKILKNSLEISDVLHKNSDYLVLFMKTIEDISTKIHILSMNASITAARLGDAGKPFMVVAKEVRKLSEEVSSSVKEMNDYSKILQSSINEVKHLITSVFTEIDSTYTDINTIIQNFEGFYLSLTVINKMILSNIKENSKFFNDISSIIASYSDNNSQIEEYLNKMNNNSINDFLDYINSNITKLTNKS